ncbi:amidohydrolase [Pseudoalteromonas luteoviolacea]|uniref:amidohydrolase family protein n=1 Tax=Pseudoalteromonas luteoviolacea TaxID=43657 RepID=UPI001B36D8BD|nr:amidohydrolase family protein [Pseudoalteromonas luteoviolacea]MBQ4809905.1 amidohydrolase [Pseudoalteromonas luteoviolacea]
MIVIDCDRHIMEELGMWQQYLKPETLNGFEIRLETDSDEKREKRARDGFADVSLPPTYKVGDYDILSNWGLEMQIATALIESSSGRERSLAKTPAGQIVSMNETNISVALIFPTFTGYIVNHEKVDPKTSLQYAQAYNHWLQDFCSFDQSRLIPVGIVSRHDTRSLKQQVEEISKKGWRAITIRPEPILGKNLSHPDNEAFWQACEDNDIAVTFHGGTHLQGQTVGIDRFTSRFSLHACSHVMEAQMAFIDLLEGGVLERHPKLQFVFLEAGCSWVAGLLWRLDNICYNEFPSLTEGNIKMHPSEYFKRQCWVAVEIGEPIADTLKAIGHEKLIFGSDFPHPDHLHFDLKQIAEELPELSQTQINDILETNPKRLFKL